MMSSGFRRDATPSSVNYWPQLPNPNVDARTREPRFGTGKDISSSVSLPRKRMDER